MDYKKFFKYIIAFFLPPVGVWISGGHGFELLINILLTVVAYIPGNIYIYYIIILRANFFQI